MLKDYQELEKTNHIFKNRPPNVWNEPESVEKDHFLRCSADPFVIYKDSRIRELHDFVGIFGAKLRETCPEKW